MSRFLPAPHIGNPVHHSHEQSVSDLYFFTPESASGLCEIKLDWEIAGLPDIIRGKYKCKRRRGDAIMKVREPANQATMKLMKKGVLGKGRGRGDEEVFGNDG